MIDIRNKGLKFLILGYGVSGKSTYSFLKDRGYLVSVFDDTRASENPAIEDIRNFDVVVKSPGVPFMQHNIHPVVREANEAGVPVVTNYDVFSLFNSRARTVMITGTNGKSTTSALTDHILRESGRKSVVGGNIGIPYGDLPMAADIYVFEMSSYELAVSKYMDFEIGCILNIEPDHLENHGSFENYIMAKHNGLDHSKIKIISYDDENTMARYRGEAITISDRGNMMADIYVDDNERLVDNMNNVESDLSGLSGLRGRHNRQNSAFAYAVCSHFGLSADDILSGMASFKSLPHRLNIVRTIGNTLFVNDSKATNPGAGACALEAFSAYDIFWIIGGRSKKTNVRKHVDQFMEKVRKIYMVGEAMDEFEAEFRDTNETERSETIERAVSSAYRDAQKSPNSSVVLFSPMCASFDQFANYCERGDYFSKIVLSIYA
jgi:UDP-N-acetylmuramoylalanine--D-glutamate ligase